VRKVKQKENECLKNILYRRDTYNNIMSRARIEKLMEWDINREYAKQLDESMRKIHSEYLNRRKSVGERSARELMKEVDRVVHGYGIEELKCTPLIYINMGDTYNTTLLFNTSNGMFDVWNWGDWLEAYQKRHSTKECNEF
jgi:hypothetical protein